MSTILALIIFNIIVTVIIVLALAYFISAVYVIIATLCAIICDLFRRLLGKGK